ncbi:MAG: zf-HC2 domain-containing protein [Thermanaerothrix sp.]|nr:zf-HC2 domain-containing protein [Thermanaerothrix sp.]
MSDHVTHLLDAYLDGELRPAERQRVAQHLATCATCHHDLQARQTLSTWIHPLPEDLPLTPGERFTAQVMLRLPPRQTATAQPAHALVWAVPLVLLIVWSALQVIWGAITWLRFGAQSGLLASEAPGWLTLGTRSLWLALLTLLGSTAPSPALQTVLQWLQQADHWLGEWLGLFTWQAQIALFYLIWLLLWVLHRNRTHPAPFEPTNTMKSV